MTLVTGTPVGSITSSEDLYLEGAPTIYFQDYNATPLKNPDADGFYWGLSGTTTYPAYELGCVTAVSMTENLTMNDVLCDNVGVKSTIMQRNYIELQFTLQSFFPLDILTHILKFGDVAHTPPVMGMGMGKIVQNKYWMVYAPKVYNDDVGDYIVVQLHKAQFVNAFTINMNFGSPWQVTGIVLRAMADATKPSTQSFGVFMRADASVIT